MKRVAAGGILICGVALAVLIATELIGSSSTLEVAPAATPTTRPSRFQVTPRASESVSPSSKPVVPSSGPSSVGGAPSASTWWPVNFPDGFGADGIGAVAHTLSELDKAHFAGLVVDEDRLTITCYWKGSAPGIARRFIAQKPEGVTVTLVEGAKYSRAEGQNAIARIFNDPIASKLDVVSADAAIDGSGIRVQVVGEAPSANTAAKVARIAGLDVEDIVYEANSDPIEPL